MDSGTQEWWRRHGWTIVLLAAAFALTFFIRTLYMVPLIQQWGALFTYGGGSDSYYHSRVTTYIILNHTNLIHDPLLNYPLGAINPREPLFDWMNAILGMIFAPLFGGNAVEAGAWFLVFAGPFWAALSVIPIYLIGREVSSPKVGLVAALLYPLSVASIDSSTFGYANYLSFYTFVILIFVYSFLRTVKAAGTRRWVDSYGKPRTYPAAVRGFLRTERMAVKWAVFTGVSLGALALAWQGYTFAITLVVVFLLFALIVERLRRVDSFGLYLTLWIIGIVGFAMAIPYYVPQGDAIGWFELPALLYFGALLIVLPFLLMRDYPWVVSIPVLAGIAAAALGALYFVNHSFFVNIVTGQGYFVKTLVYQTVAEAQAPSIDSLIIGYGVATLFIAFIGLGLYVYSTIRMRFRRIQMVFLVFAIISLYLPFSAAKFLYVGSAAFVLLPAIAIVQLLEVGKYQQLRRDVTSLRDRRSQFSALGRSIKPRHLLVMALVVVIVFPNVWYSIDAGIPYNNKNTYSQQIYQTLPPFLRGTNPNASLGAAGTELDTPNQYDSAGYNWLATQDLNLPQPQRPALISWWDYGFQAVDQGQHPSVADNFQNGITPAGTFLLSQNESIAIATLATRLLTSEQVQSGNPYLPADLNAILARDGLNVPHLQNLLVNQSKNIPLVLSDPDLYLPFNESTINEETATYIAVSYYIAGATNLNGVAQIYGDIERYTGWNIRYVMVDNRLFPFSGSDTGIFYAPAELTGRIIGSGGAPVTYFTVSATGSDGNTYPVNQVPSGVTVVQYNINYNAPFYNSMIYRTYIGYNGTDVGMGEGIPGLSGSAQVQSLPIMPAWMMEHFEVVYRTAYFCPYANPSAHPGCFGATNLPTAAHLANTTNGTADTSASSYFQGGLAFLEYYNGQPVVGTVRTSTGQPVSNARVTVYDQFHIPHMTTVTGANGAYSVILPPGNVTVNVTTGTFNAVAQAGETLLASYKIFVSPALALQPGAPTMVLPITFQPATVNTFTYWNLGGNSSYDPSVDPVVAGASVTLWGHNLTTLSQTTDASGTATFSQVPPGIYNYSVNYHGWNFTTAMTVNATVPGQTVNQTTPLSPASVLGHVTLPDGSPAANALVSVTGPTGLVSSGFTNSTGAFNVSRLPPGNYSVSATLPAASLLAPATFIAISSPGQKVTSNLTLVSSVSVFLTVLANGAPAAGFSVRFSPIPSLAAPPNTTGNGSGPPKPSLSPATLNSTVFVTNAAGQIVASLPSDDYSVYGLGLVGSSVYAGFKSIYVSQASGSLFLPPLVLSPAVRLAGTAALPPGATPTTGTLVTVYNPRGDQVYTFSNLSSTWAVYVPAGQYTVGAIEGQGATQGTLYAALANVTAPSGTVDLAMGIGDRLSAVVGEASFSETSGFVPAIGAVARLTLEPEGATMATITNSSGNISFIAPIDVPTGSTYCLNVSATGFEPYLDCGIPPENLGLITVVPLTASSVPVTMTVVGLPTGSSLTVNLTANSSTAHSVVVTGGPVFNLVLAPGDYSLTAWAPSPTPPGLLLPTAPELVRIPIGVAQVNVTFFVATQVPTNGTLLLPYGVTNSTVSLELSSSVMNLSLSGSTFEKSFFVAPGSYHLYATAIGPDGTPYSNLSVLSFNRTGVPSASVDLTANGVNLTGHLVRPTGQYLDANTTILWSGAEGGTIVTPVTDGAFTAVVPPGLALTPALNVTQLVSTPYGPRYESFTPTDGFSCSVSSADPYCNITLAATPITTQVSGSLIFGAFPGNLTGSIRFVGPLPSRNVTIVAATTAGFSWAALPGTYSIYAATGNGPGALANVSQVVIAPTSAQSLVLNLARTWILSLTITAPANSGIVQASLWFHGPSDVNLELDSQPVSTPLSFALPAGVYTVQANATASPFGVPARATAASVINLANGNAATLLPMAYSFQQVVAFTLLPPTSATIVNGGSASFAFSLRNTGNTPVSFHLVGSPSSWSFAFSQVNYTLQPTSPYNAASGSVFIRVPSGTAVDHPPIVLEAVLDQSNTTVLGVATPAPRISILTVVGLVAGVLPASQASIGPTEATLPFYIVNTGNSLQNTSVTIQNIAQLASLGWIAAVYNGQTLVETALTLDAGSNTSLSIHMDSPMHLALPPGYVVVSIRVLGAQPMGATLNVPVPTLGVRTNSTTVIVTGPSVGSPSPYPDWLVPVLSFVPAIAVVVAVVVYRWNKNRRWKRR